MNKTTLTIFLVLGLILLITYSYIFRLNKTEYEALWTNNGTNKITNNNNLRTFNKISIFLATISGIFLLYYLTTTNINIFDLNTEDSNYTINTILLILIGFSILWIPSFYINFINTKFILFMVALASIILFISLLTIHRKNNIDNIAIVASFIIMFQTFVMDLILW